MRHSTERILTTHVGSLPRPADLRAMWAKKAVTAEDEAALQTRLRSAIGEVVLAQKNAGIDVPNDGEFGKPILYQSFTYGVLAMDVYAFD
jgi:5-methyltetrahydropteroyltriglutamate--homocysteine methyltransferase